MQRGADIIWTHDKRQTSYRISHFGVDEEGYPVVVYHPLEEPAKTHTRRCHEFFDGRFRQVDATPMFEEDEDFWPLDEQDRKTKPKSVPPGGGAE